MDHLPGFLFRALLELRRPGRRRGADRVQLHHAGAQVLLPGADLADPLRRDEDALGLAQRALRAGALGDVERHAHHPDHLPGQIADRTELELRGRLPVVDLQLARLAGQRANVPYGA